MMGQYSVNTGYINHPPDIKASSTRFSLLDIVTIVRRGVATLVGGRKLLDRVAPPDENLKKD